MRGFLQYSTIAHRRSSLRAPTRHRTSLGGCGRIEEHLVWRDDDGARVLAWLQTSWDEGLRLCVCCVFSASSLNEGQARSLRKSAVLFWDLKRDPNLENYPYGSKPKDGFHSWTAFV